MTHDNDATTDEALRLMGERRVRQASTIAILSTIAALAMLWLASRTGMALHWYAAGLTAGIGFTSWGGLLAIVVNTQRMFAAKDRLHASAEMLADFVNDELRRRGPDFVAVLMPDDGIRIQWRDAPPSQGARLH